MTERLRSIYGDRTGRVLIVESEVGNVVPPIPGYTWLGEGCDVFARLGFHIKQADVAAVVGVQQQTISGYASGRFEPYPPSWSPIIRLLFEVCLDQPDHQHTAELYRANIRSPAHRRRAS